MHYLKFFHDRKFFMGSVRLCLKVGALSYFRRWVIPTDYGRIKTIPTLLTISQLNINGQHVLDKPFLHLLF